MKYGILLWPHANSRYQEAVEPLALAELRLLLSATGIQAEVNTQTVCGASLLCFESEPLTPRQCALIERHSMMYLLCVVQGDLLQPIGGKTPPYLGSDLSGILKYKGKTNEAFTRLLMNLSLCASDFTDRFDDKLALIDPMCGRMTTLFEAVNRGYDAYGIDCDSKELSEGLKFFKKYLEYHRFKHQACEQSLTLQGKLSARLRTFDFANDPQAYKEGKTIHLAGIGQDSELSLNALGKEKFHLAAFDLPYGVQRGPGGKDSFEQLLKRTLIALKRTLKKGGAVAISFNSYTLPTQAARQLLETAGFAVMSGGDYNEFKHWVEQAIVRDIVIGKKTK
jgi:Predicted DNA modification methylase